MHPIMSPRGMEFSFLFLYQQFNIDIDSPQGSDSKPLCKQQLDGHPLAPIDNDRLGWPDADANGDYGTNQELFLPAN